MLRFYESMHLRKSMACLPIPLSGNHLLNRTLRASTIGRIGMSKMGSLMWQHRVCVTMK